MPAKTTRIRKQYIILYGHNTIFTLLLVVIFSLFRGELRFSSLGISAGIIGVIILLFLIVGFLLPIFLSFRNVITYKKQLKLFLFGLISYICFAGLFFILFYAIVQFLPFTRREPFSIIHSFSGPWGPYAAFGELIFTGTLLLFFYKYLLRNEQQISNIKKNLFSFISAFLLNPSLYWGIYFLALILTESYTD